jgi:glycosyltransferase involved in cell wall biosynthesis
MLVRRQAWREVGELDAEAFGRGYGEENDWCQRALKQGWQHLFCPATFVVHKGGQSFSADKAALVQKNSQVLNARHPGYDLEVQKFIAKDPIKTWRAMLTHQLDIKKTAGSILHIVHGKEGGVLRHVADIRAQVPDMSHVVLKAMENVWWLEIADTRYEFVRQPDQLWSDYLQQICACFDVRFIHLHHWVTCAEGLRLALAETHLPYGVTLHDFYTSCPLVHLINSQEQYCQAPTEVSTCSQCLAQDTVKHSVKIAPYRQAHEQLLQHAKFVLAPSQFTQRVLQQYFSAIDIKVVPHSVNSPAYEPRRRDLQGERTRVAVVGAIGPVKGARQLEQLAQYLQQQQADWELHLIGYLDTHFHPGVLYGGYLHIHGAYPQNQLAAHLHRHHTAVVLFPSLGPETYSYTLSDVWLAGLSVVCTDVGTVAERVRSCDGGWVLSKPTSAKDWQSTWVQEIAQILSAENAELRKAKAERGQKSIIAEQAIMPSRLQAYYHENRGESMEAQAKPDASQQVAALRWQALQSETQVNHTSTKITWPRRIILFLLRYALACRRTRLGRSLETMMPSHLKHRLRASLLAH